MRHLVLLLAAAADPGGWAVARWGMQPAQVPGAVKLEESLRDRTFNHGVAEFGQDIRLGETAWRAYFFAGKDGLDRVMLRPVDRTDATQTEFQRVENLLAIKYGRPFDRTSGNTRTAVWSFPSTVITLQLTGYRPQVQLRTMWLIYERRRPADLDQLN